MIHQFAELGQYYREQEGIGTSSEDRLALYSQDPAQKFRTNTVLFLVLSNEGFRRVQVEQYDDSKRLLYLYRADPPNGWDATPTSGLRQVKGKTQTEFDRAFIGEVRKKLARLRSSVADALQGGVDLPSEEKTRLEKMRACLLSAATSKGGQAQLREIVDEILGRLPSQSAKNVIHSQDAILSLAWETTGRLNRVGDFVTFKQSIIRQGLQSASTNGGHGTLRGLASAVFVGSQTSRCQACFRSPTLRFTPWTSWGRFPVGSIHRVRGRTFLLVENAVTVWISLGKESKRSLPSITTGGSSILFSPALSSRCPP